MASLFGNLTPSSALGRFLNLLRHYGLWETAAVCVAMVDDFHVRSFDRRYGVRTSGHVELSNTSFDPSKLAKATSYGPVNAWGVRKLLRTLNLPKSFAFVDLGCGLGRPCILAAEYGFRRVTGVELAPELCRVARENVANCRAPGVKNCPIHVIEGDVLDYCDHSDDDVYFVYRAFSLDFLNEVVAKLTQRAAVQKKPFTFIYTERLGWPQGVCVSALDGNRALRKTFEKSIFGQSFFVYEYQPEFP